MCFSRVLFDWRALFRTYLQIVSLLLALMEINSWEKKRKHLYNLLSYVVKWVRRHRMIKRFNPKYMRMLWNKLPLMIKRLTLYLCRCSEASCHCMKCLLKNASFCKHSNRLLFRSSIKAGGPLNWKITQWSFERNVFLKTVCFIAECGRPVIFAPFLSFLKGTKCDASITTNTHKWNRQNKLIKLYINRE